VLFSVEKSKNIRHLYRRTISFKLLFCLRQK